MSNEKRWVATLLAATLVGAAPAWASAEGDQAAATQSATIPDWNGVWVLQWMVKKDTSFLATPGRADAASAARAAGFAFTQPAYKGEYLARFQAARKTRIEGKDDSAAACLPPGLPGFWTGPYAFEITQTSRQINLYQEGWEQTRRIYLDERAQPAPDDLTPSYNGHSIGHWEGNVLLIDTVGITTETRMPHSDAMHASERIEGEGPDRLKVTMTVEDPQALVKPWVTVTHLYRKHGMEIMEYVCEENNRAR